MDRRTDRIAISISRVIKFSKVVYARNFHVKLSKYTHNIGIPVKVLAIINISNVLYPIK